MSEGAVGLYFWNLEPIESRRLDNLDVQYSILGAGHGFFAPGQKACYLPYTPRCAVVQDTEISVRIG